MWCYNINFTAFMIVLVVKLFLYKYKTNGVLAYHTFLMMCIAVKRI